MLHSVLPEHCHIIFMLQIVVMLRIELKDGLYGYLSILK